jgi:hypothetical protein
MKWFQVIPRTFRRWRTKSLPSYTKIDPSGHVVGGALYKRCFCCHSLSVRSGVSTIAKTEFVIFVMTLRSLVEVTDVSESLLLSSFNKVITFFTEDYLIIREQRSDWVMTPCSVVISYQVIEGKYCLHHSCATLKMEAPRFSEMLATGCWTSRRHIQQDIVARVLQVP